MSFPKPLFGLNPQVASDKKLLTVLYLKFFKICDICCSTNAMGEKSNIFLSTYEKFLFPINKQNDSIIHISL